MKAENIIKHGIIVDCYKAEDSVITVIKYNNKTYSFPYEESYIKKLKKESGRNG